MQNHILAYMQNLDARQNPLQQQYMHHLSFNQAQNPFLPTQSQNSFTSPQSTNSFLPLQSQNLFPYPQEPLHNTSDSSQQRSEIQSQGIVGSSRQSTDLNQSGTRVNASCLSLASNSNSSLPSSEIPKHMLQDARVVLEENAKLRTESSAGTLCQKLAKEAFFGKDIMKKCTPNGTREFPALPRAEMYGLKLLMFQQFPRFQNCPGAFEVVWKKCMVAIEQACKRLRAQC